MDQRAQQIALAIFDGWKYVSDYHGDLDGIPPNCQYTECVPNYLYDLKAMHDLEEKHLPLGDEVKNGVGVEVYCQILAEVVGCDIRGNSWVEDIKLIRATAAQRAEAFLKTFNLWVE